MRRLDKRWTIRLGALALSAVLLGTVAALAAGGVFAHQALYCPVSPGGHAAGRAEPDGANGGQA